MNGSIGGFVLFSYEETTVAKPLFKVTTRSVCYTHYFVRAEDQDAAEDAFYNDDWERCEDDPLYGDAEEEILEVDIELVTEE